MVLGVYNFNSELSKYGLSSTGNIQSDIAALKKAKQAKGESTLDIDNFATTIKQVHKNGSADKTNNKNKTGQPTLPWTSLMQSLGIEPQGSKEADFAAISAKLEQMQASATTADQQANLATLQAQFAQFQNMDKQMQGLNFQNPIANNQQQNGMPSQPNLPWGSLMQSLGLSLQGSPSADFTAISSKISQMKSMSLTADQQANLASIQTQFEQYKNTFN